MKKNFTNAFLFIDSNLKGKALMFFLLLFAVNGFGQFTVDLGSDIDICPNDTTEITATISNPSTCTVPCTLTGEELIAHWDMEDCASFANNNSNADYSEFTNPFESNSTCSDVNINGLYRAEGLHSCTDDANNGDPGDAVCFGMPDIPAFVDNHPYAVKFDVTINPNSGFSGITKLEFQEFAPEEYLWTQQNIPSNSGPNNYPTMYGIRVLKDGAEIFKQVDLPTEQTWNLESFDFTSIPEFSSNTTAVYTFEFLAYAPVGNGSPAFAWDMDDIKVYAGCCTTTTTNDVSYLWSTGETNATISTAQAGEYSVTVTDCDGFLAADTVMVNVTDADNDGVCDSEDCAPNDAFYPNTPGITCDDNNPGTMMDVVQSDSCSCAGIPIPGISINDVTVNEEDGNATLDICIDQTTTVPVTVDFSTVDGTAVSATSPADFTAVSSSVTIAPGETCVQINIPIIDDATPEDTEEFFVQLSNSANSNIVDTSGNVTILDIDFIIPNISINDVTVNEEDGNATLDICIDQTTTVPVLVDYATADGSATNPDDYTTSSNSVIIAAGETCVQINVPIIDDATPEDTEEFFVLLSNAANGVIADTSGTVTILDTDFIIPNIAINDVTVNEEDGNATLDICIDQVTTVPVTVDFATSDGSATNPDDYTTSSNSVVIAAGETCVQINVPIIDDATPEDTEEFFVLLSNAANGVIADTSGTVTILDTDFIIPNIAINDVTVNEEDGNATLDICIDQVTTVPVTVDFATADGSATNPDDYTTSANSVTIAAGETCVQISVPIIDDATPEDTEEFFVLLSNAANGVIADTSGTVTILDTDFIIPNIAINDVTVNEEDGNATLDICIDQVTTVPVSVDFATSDGSATNPDDYTTSASSVTIAAGETCVQINVPIIDDATPEDTEEFFVLLSNAANGVIADTSGTVTILDTDFIIPNIAINDVTVNEEDGNATLQICVDQLTTVPVTVDYATADGSAILSTDYQATTGSATIAAGEFCAEIQVPIIDDAVPEDTETFIVQLNNAVNGIIADSSGNVYILDTDVIIPGITINNVTVNEEDGTASLDVCLDQTTTLDVSVDFMTVDQTAVAGDDYQNTVGSVMILAGETCSQISIPIIDDNNPEPTENFIVTLNNPVNGTLTNDTGQVTILDIDPDCSTLQVSAQTEDLFCAGDTSGFIETTVTGGTGNYTFGWSNGATSQNIYDLTAGDYTLVVMDANGCSVTSTYTINSPSFLEILGSATNVNCFGENNGSVELAVSGGTPPYSYAWSNGANTKNINNLAGNTYTVVVTDNNFCQATATFTVDEPTQALSLVATKTDAVCEGSSDGTIDLTILGGTAPYSTIWNNGATTEDLQDLAAGTYTAIVTDANGCEDMVSITINEPVLNTSFNTEKTICQDIFVGFEAEDEGPGATYEWYFWNGPTTSSTFLGTASGQIITYSFNSPGDKLVRLIATTQAGCAIEYDEVINVLAANDPACSNCDNVTNGGVIGKDQVGCAPMVTNLIVNNEEPSGGSGDIEFMWMESLVGTTPTSITDPNWTIIPGATSKNYDAGTINTTTYYIRLSKRVDCEDWLAGMSNIITKEVLGDAITASFETEMFICPYIPSIFNADTVNATASYTWYFFNGPTASDPYLGSREGLEVDFLFTSAGEKLVRLYVETDYGCSSTHEIVITVLSPFDPNCAANIIPENITLEAGLDENNEVVLDWSTVNEGLDVFYDIQRSDDGINYQVVSTLTGQNAESSSYTYTDVKPAIGVNYYRIKKFNAAGGFVLSNVQEVVYKLNTETRTASTYPNPVEGMTSLVLSDPFEKDAIIEVSNAYGKTVQSLTIPAGVHKIEIDLTGYQAGFYFIYTNENGYRQLVNKVLKLTE